MNRTAQLAPLGPQRLRILDCLGGNSPRAPGYFAPPEGCDVFDAFRHHIVQLSQQWAAETDPLVISLLAAGRFLTGDLTAADGIIDQLPAKPVKLDHGAGICLVAPVYALKAALPLPQNLDDTACWVSGSTEQAALRAWFAEHREQLRWIEPDGVYVAR